MSLPPWATDEENINKANANKVVKSAAITISSGAIRFVSSLATAIILGRLLTPADFGLVGMVMPILAFVGIFADGGVSNYTLQAKKLTQEEMSQIFWIGAAFSILLFLVMFALSPLVAYFYGDQRLSTINAVVAMSLLVAIFSTQHNALVKRCYKQKLFAIAEISGSLSGAVVGINLALLGASYWALVSVPIVRHAVHGCVIWFLTRWIPTWPNWDREKAKELMGFGGYVVLSIAMVTGSKNLDKVLLGLMYEAKEVGYYAMAYNIMMLPFFQVLTPAGGAIVPYLSQLRENPSKYSDSLAKIVIGLGFVVAPGMALAALRSEPLLVFVLGEQWRPSANIFSMLALCSINMTLVMPLNWALIASGKPAKLAKWSSMSVIPIVGSFALGLPWGGFGVATAYFIYTALYLCIFPYYVSKYLEISYKSYVSSALLIILVAALSSSVVYITGQIFNLEHGKPLILLIVSFLLYLVFTPVFFIVVFGRRQTKEMVSAVKNRKKINRSGR